VVAWIPRVIIPQTRALVVAFAVAVTACGTTPMRTVAATHPPTVDATLGPGDTFDVRVFEESDLAGTYRVDADGYIDFPLVGRLLVAGKLPGELANLLRDRLSAFVKQPQVSVFVREMTSKRIIVYGQVQKPGTYPYTNPMTISELISLAGGFTPMAAREKVTISRYEKDEQHIIEVNLRAIADGKAPNHFVEPGDQVYVPERLF
jgi:polysaccharide export outer membrane protein